MELPIVNECNRLPPMVMRHISTSLRWIPPLDLVGIDHIRLVDQISEGLIESRKKQAEFVLEEANTGGLYVRKTATNPAFIFLIIKDLYYPIPYFANFSSFPILYVARALAHEVGHHLINTRGYIFQPDEKCPSYERKPEFEEEMADRYAFGVVAKMKEKITYKIGACMMCSFSKYHDVLARSAWEAKNYRVAADRWLKSFLLNPESPESSKWYWYSRQKLEICENEDVSSGNG